MRSFAGILFDVFTSHKTITMIDEPEAFLHPPQARLLGRMLVKNKPNDRQFFISTHSEDFLKGLLDADSENVRIVRIERDGDVNNIKELDNNGVKSLRRDSNAKISNSFVVYLHVAEKLLEQRLRSRGDCRSEIVQRMKHDKEALIDIEGYCDLVIHIDEETSIGDIVDEIVKYSLEWR